MARKVKDTQLDTREARKKLPQRHEPYWRLISQGRHIGYRKGRVKRGTTPRGKWIARLYDGEKYKKKALAEADDIRDANGVDVLTFAQAQNSANEWFGVHGSPAVDMESTVAAALDGYVKWFEEDKRGLPSYKHAVNNLKKNIEVHIRPRIGDIKLADLTSHDVGRIRDEVAGQPARIRTKLGKDQNYRELGDDPETVRRRRVTANKILNIAKAALNRAYFHDKDLSKAIRSDEPWRRVKPWPKVEKPVIEYLSVNEQKRLVNACGDDFRALVQAALLTGCRYGELSALTAKDYNPDAGTVYIRHAKAGKERHVFLTNEAQVFFEQQIVDKGRGDLIFRRKEGEVWKSWGMSHQRRRMMEACERAKIDRPIRFHDLRHSYASRLATQGVPLAMIAEQLGHSDTRITERNYSHLAKSVVADTVRAAFGELGIVEPDNVTALK